MTHRRDYDKQGRP